MKFIVCGIVCLFSITLFAQEETLIKLLEEKPKQAVVKIAASIEDNYCYGKSISIPMPMGSMELPPKSIEIEIPTFLMQGNRHAALQSSLYFETYAVLTLIIDGYSFHIADYYDGTRVVTCLNGPLMGLQTVSFNGTKLVESTNVHWYADYCIHYYQTGKIYSYNNRQIIEVY